MRRRRLLGFTLLELMMAIALVGVLTAIALPIYSGYRLKVQNAQAQQDVVAMSAAIQSYWVAPAKFVFRSPIKRNATP